MTFVRITIAAEAGAETTCYLQRMRHAGRGINKIVQFSNIRTQQRIVCAQFMFVPSPARAQLCTKVRKWNALVRDDDIVQATPELQHS